jgi:hypothetical protein
VVRRTAASPPAHHERFIGSVHEALILSSDRRERPSKDERGLRLATLLYSAACGVAATSAGVFFAIAWRAHSAADSTTAIMPIQTVTMKKSW